MPDAECIEKSQDQINGGQLITICVKPNLLFAKIMKHTPGPWRVDYAMGIRGADNVPLAYVLSDSSSVPTPNAQLMAAAPELLEALISAQRFLNPLSGLIETKEWDHLENVRDKIGSAIEKATGEK